MFSSRIANALNQQMNNEFDAAQSYMAMAAYCEYNNYGGFAHFYLQQAAEERFHGMKIYQYLNDRGVHAEFTGVTAPKINFDSILDTFESALQQEKGVTKDIYALTDLAWEEKEHATISFLQWFLDEQVEEESSFDTHIEYLKRIGEDKNALYIYEKELGQRSFNAENEA
ncbi:ferritin [Lederbergia lenta]|uniref:Ferritin n=1 Tax=Lederbergia lenta TaxID=1467 RepID=A0A2X4VLD7_LEDLE|nr:ferritin [Lederbergia lenta]MCM3112436.1 ferritin [Lederbergia lenta]MEC2323469.1 ferritin [Lederbergia lenta]SQI52966.1 ferritin [Lederbergia lenta]